MPSLPRCVSPLATVLVLAVGLSAAPADDKDAVKDRLFEAKKEYDGEVRKFRQAVNDVLDKREGDARDTGNKKALDAVKAERDRFDKTGEFPAGTPRAALAQVNGARAKLENAYSAAVKDLIKLKEDAAAEATEKEQQKFQLESALAFGKRTYLVALRHFDIKTNNGKFSDDGSIPGSKGLKLAMNGEPVPHSVFLHVPIKGHSQVSYVLGGRWTAFRATIGVPKIEEKTGAPASPLTFEVLADGKSVWKSEPVKKVEAFQTCELRVEKVKALTLRVHCPGSDSWGRTVWYEPIVVE